MPRRKNQVPPPLPGENPDGRRRRGDRTRQRLFEAAGELMRERDEMPTVAQIAQRAGVVPRTLYQHFPDSAALYGATFDHFLAAANATLPDLSSSGPLKDRIQGFVERRAQICEEWLPLWRVGIRFARHDPTYRTRIENAVDALRIRMRILYEPELSRLSPEEQHLLIDAVTTLTDHEGWAHLRWICGYDWEKSCAVWRFGVEAQFSAMAKRG
ncbi:MAG: helix-turn-helix transcriptional regulator [Alphaproteobacteria bacterium]|nr:helix-turn-helix transcriptional regulator [Alphaproteobacteria bacterium]